MIWVIGVSIPTRIGVRVRIRLKVMVRGPGKPTLDPWAGWCCDEESMEISVTGMRKGKA